MFSNYITEVKSGWLDLNQRLHAPKAWLLATELHPVDTPGGSRSRSVPKAYPQQIKQILNLPRLPIPPQERVLAAPPGIEPGSSESKSDMLPNYTTGQ